MADSTFFDMEIAGGKEDGKQFNPLLRELTNMKIALDASTYFTTCDRNGNIIYANLKFYETLKYSKEEILGQNHRVINSGYHSLQFYKELWDTVLSGQVWKGEVRNKTKDGDFVWADTTIVPIFDETGDPIRFMTFRMDTTKWKNIEVEILNLEKKLLRKNREFELLIRNSHDIIKILDQIGTIVYQSPTIEKLTGYKANELIGKNTFSFVHPEDQGKVLDVFHRVKLIPRSSSKVQYRLQHANGSWINCEAVLSNLLDDPNVNGIIINYWDITEVKTFENKINHLVNYDNLTGIANRKLIEEILIQKVIEARESNSNVAYIKLDLDGFKNINDSVGYNEGDLLLKRVARRLDIHFQHIGFVARIGSDEFGIVIPGDFDKNQIQLFCEQTMTLIKMPFVISNYEFNITASIGVSSLDDEYVTSVEMLIKHANLAMYQAKEQGKNQYISFVSSMGISNNKAFNLNNDLGQALLKNQLTLYYQPRVSHLSKRLVGAEALIRWNHPKFGLVSPKEFITLAENSGRIIAIGDWVFESVCKQLNNWEQAGYSSIKISLNFSLLQFLQSNFIEKIKNTIEKYRISPHSIEIEITESVVLSNEEIVTNRMKELSEIGIDIAIDDFGTGYSSFLYLKKLKINTIKIDKSFIQDIDSNDWSYNIVIAIIQLSKKMKLNIVLEGIETIKQYRLVKKMNFDEIQGFLFGKPVPPDEFESFLKNRKMDTKHFKKLVPTVNKWLFFKW